MFNENDEKQPPSNPYSLRGVMKIAARPLGLTDANGVEINTFMPFIVYTMAVDGEDARTKMQKKKSDEDGIADALNALGISVGTKPPAKAAMDEY